MKKTVKKMLLVSMLGSMCILGKSQCEDICDIKQSVNGMCTICYNECSDTGQTTYLSCSIAMEEEGQEQELTQTMCKGLCYPQEFPQLQVDVASLTQTSSAIVEQQNENQVQGQQNLLTQSQDMIEPQGQIEPSLRFEEQPPTQEYQQNSNEEENQKNSNKEEYQQNQDEEEVNDEELNAGLLNEGEQIAESNEKIGEWNKETNDENGQQIIEESGQGYQNQEENMQEEYIQENQVDEQGQNWQEEQNINTEQEQNLVDEQEENYGQNEEMENQAVMDQEEENYFQEQQQYYGEEDEEQFQENQEYQQEQQQQEWNQQQEQEQQYDQEQEQEQQLQQEQEQEWKQQDQVYQQEQNVQNNPLLSSQQEANQQQQQSNDQQQTQQQTQQPLTSTGQALITQQQQNPQSVSTQQQKQITVQQLKKLKQQTEGWAPSNQNLLQIILALIASSIVFVIAFTQIYKCIDKRRKLKQLQAKHNKEWVKFFQKVSNSDTTIGSISSRETQAFSAQDVQKQPETNEAN